jgi:hypothetical protein
MEIREFAEIHRVRLNDRKHERKFRLETSEDTIHGRYGEIVADSSYGPVLAVKFIAVPRNSVMTGALRNRYKPALAGGLVLKQKYGDAESTFHFNPTNVEHAKLALKLVGAKHRRIVNLTEEQKQALRERLSRMREGTRLPVLA